MKNYMGVGVAVGVGAGTALGAPLHNIPAWVAIGAALGVVLGAVMNRRKHLYTETVGRNWLSLRFFWASN